VRAALLDFIEQQEKKHDKPAKEIFEDYDELLKLQQDYLNEGLEMPQAWDWLDAQADLNWLLRHVLPQAMGGGLPPWIPEAHKLHFLCPRLYGKQPLDPDGWLGSASTIPLPSDEEEKDAQDDSGDGGNDDEDDKGGKDENRDGAEDLRDLMNGPGDPATDNHGPEDSEDGGEDDEDDDNNFQVITDNSDTSLTASGHPPYGEDDYYPQEDQVTEQAAKSHGAGDDQSPGINEVPTDQTDLQTNPSVASTRDARFPANGHDDDVQDSELTEDQVREITEELKELEWNIKQAKRDVEGTTNELGFTLRRNAHNTDPADLVTIQQLLTAEEGLFRMHQEFRAKTRELKATNHSLNGPEPGVDGMSAGQKLIRERRKEIRKSNDTLEVIKYEQESIDKRLDAWDLWYDIFRDGKDELKPELDTRAQASTTEHDDFKPKLDALIIRLQEAQEKLDDEVAERKTKTKRKHHDKRRDRDEEWALQHPHEAMKLPTEPGNGVSTTQAKRNQRKKEIAKAKLERGD
jgi:hypothetical protein